MTARIFCKVGELQGLSAEIGDEATLGRSRQATIPIRAELISGEHARIRYEPTERCYVLEDLGSTNGTELDGMKVRGRERLGHLHVITLAESYDLIFQDLGLCGARGSDSPREPVERVPSFKEPSLKEPYFKEDTAFKENTAIQEMPPVLPGALAGGPVPEDTSIDSAPFGLPSALLERAEEIHAEKRPEPPPTVKLPDDFPEQAAAASPPSLTLSPSDTPPPTAIEDEVETADLAFALEVRKAEGSVSFRLKDGENVVGRTDECHVKLDTMDVSRRHAVLTVRGGGVTLRDLGSSNHTFLEGARITEAVRVPVGASIKFGSLEASLVLWEAEEDT